jgi:hypothetical protein
MGHGLFILPNLPLSPSPSPLCPLHLCGTLREAALRLR